VRVLADSFFLTIASLPSRTIMKVSLPLTTTVLSLALTASLPAASVIYNINADGAKEVTSGGIPNQGDPDGTSIGTLLLDNGTGLGTTGFATFNLTMFNIDLTTLSGHHVHQGAATTTGSIVLNFGDPDNIRSGSVLSGTITGLSAATITEIFANPTNFYYNLHNGDFPAGAVRDQLVPEPASAALLLLGAGGLLSSRRRRVG
jgi:hypothetical protein